MFNRTVNVQYAILINTLLQRGVKSGAEVPNRFNGFGHSRKTAEAVVVTLARAVTSLKQGVNEMKRHSHPLFTVSKQIL
jgi:PII-like signaling protein